jgi:hypothetical protein
LGEAGAGAGAPESFFAFFFAIPDYRGFKRTKT